MLLRSHKFFHRIIFILSELTLYIDKVPHSRKQQLVELLCPLLCLGTLHRSALSVYAFDAVNNIVRSSPQLLTEELYDMLLKQVPVITHLKARCLLASILSVRPQCKVLVDMNACADTLGDEGIDYD